jgi:hypothetical protein
MDGQKRPQCLKYVFALCYVVLVYNFILFFVILGNFTGVTSHLDTLNTNADTGLANLSKCVTWTGKAATFKA